MSDEEAVNPVELANPVLVTQWELAYLISLLGGFDAGLGPIAPFLLGTAVPPGPDLCSAAFSSLGLRGLLVDGDGTLDLDARLPEVCRRLAMATTSVSVSTRPTSVLVRVLASPTGPLVARPRSAGVLELLAPVADMDLVELTSALAVQLVGAPDLDAVSVQVEHVRGRSVVGDAGRSSTHGDTPGLRPMAEFADALRALLDAGGD